MTAPSFSSFPASFLSFPDFDSEKNDSKHDNRHGKDDKKRHKKHKYKKARHESSCSRETSPGGKEKVTTEDTLQNQVFYSDRRGDFLNIQFGGLHVGDVPKYQVIDSMVKLLSTEAAKDI